MTARMFTAVVPPREVVEQLISLVDPRIDSFPGVRWTAPESWHLTTAFMERVERSDVEELTANLAEVAASTAPFEVTLSGAVAFPNAYRAKIVAMACPSEPLAHLSTKTRNAATRAGAHPDGANFVGHLTLVRANRSIEATKLVRVIDSFPTLTWTTSSLALIESHLSDRGNRYETVEQFALTGRPGAEGS